MTLEEHVQRIRRARQACADWEKSRTQRSISTRSEQMRCVNGLRELGLSYRTIAFHVNGDGERKFSFWYWDQHAPRLDTTSRRPLLSREQHEQRKRALLDELKNAMNSSIQSRIEAEEEWSLLAGERAYAVDAAVNAGYKTGTLAPLLGVSVWTIRAWRRGGWGSDER